MGISLILTLNNCTLLEILGFNSIPISETEKKLLGCWERSLDSIKGIKPKNAFYILLMRNNRGEWTHKTIQETEDPNGNKYLIKLNGELKYSSGEKKLSLVTNQSNILKDRTFKPSGSDLIIINEENVEMMRLKKLENEQVENCSQ